MARFSTKRQEQILTEMIAKIVTRTKLSDVSDAAVIKNLLAAAATSDDEQYYNMYLLLKLFSIDKASGSDLDNRAKDIQPGLLTRNEASKASGTVVFSRNIVSGSVIIPQNTKVKTNSGIEFATTSSVTINAADAAVLPGHATGQDSSPVPIVALLAGEDGNVAASTIIKFSSKPIGVDSVTNIVPTINGLNKESDDSFRSRLRQYVLSLARSTVAALEAAVLGATDTNTGATILYAKAVEDIVNLGNVSLYIDDGTGYSRSIEVITGEIVTNGLGGPPANTAVGGETYLFLNYGAIDGSSPIVITSDLNGVLVETTDYYINSASGQINFVAPLTTGEEITASYTRFTGLIALAQKIIDGDPLDRVNYPGYRGAGVLVKVNTPQIVIQNVEANLVVSEGYDLSDIQSSVENAILNYINTLGISGDIVRSALIAAIKNIEGVYDVIIITPSSNIIVLDDQLARSTISNVDIS